MPGHRLLVRRGDVVAVDGTIVNGTGILDRSALTGESVPVRQGEGEPVMSGVTNVGDAFYLLATRRAAESTYAGIVRLVEEARSSKAPMARLADRFAIVFLIITVLLVGGAWLLTGDPVRGLAVLVVATPCPLILAVPVAIVRRVPGRQGRRPGEGRQGPGGALRACGPSSSTRPARSPMAARGSSRSVRRQE